VKIIFHVGMGKTGTTSIQVALRQNAKTLRDQNVKYLGLWFDQIDESFFGLSGTQKFRAASKEEMLEYAKKFHQCLLNEKAENGFDTFVLSNEGLFQSPDGVIDFMNHLAEMEDISVKAVAYIRNPRDWLPSAYAQWGINHKTVNGPIRTIKEMAPSLLSQYNGAKKWESDFRGELDFRVFDKSTDVISDFADAAGIVLIPPGRRNLERKETAELLLRREFNNLFQEQVLPNVFDEAVKAPNTVVEHIDQVLLDMFDTGAIDTATSEMREILDMLSEKFGMTFKESDGKSIPDAEEVRTRMMDYLVVLTMGLAKRVHNLERLLKER
jgi:hypothetical protein